MSSRLTLQVSLKVDGRELRGFPYVRRLDYSTSEQGLSYQKKEHNDWFASLPIYRLLEVTGLVVTADKETCWYFNGQQDGVIPLSPDGVIALWDTLLDDGEQSNARVLRPEDGLGIADVDFIAIGTGVEETPVDTDAGYGSSGGGFGE